MRDIWFGDNRDLVKWSVLLHLAETAGANIILQIAYYRRNDFAPISIDGQEIHINGRVKEFFRDIRKIKELANESIGIKVFGTLFNNNRATYHNEVISFIKKIQNKNSQQPLIVFLDPDTGLAPNTATLNHVENIEAEKIFKNLRPRDIFVFYQHKTNRNGQEWIEPKRRQLFEVLHKADEKVADEEVKFAHSQKIASDVAFYFIHKK